MTEEHAMASSAHGAVQCPTLHAMVHEGIAHGADGGGTRMGNMCCIVIYRNHCHRFACSIMPQLGSRAPIILILSLNGPLSFW